MALGGMSGLGRWRGRGLRGRPGAYPCRARARGHSVASMTDASSSTAPARTPSPRRSRVEELRTRRDAPAAVTWGGRARVEASDRSVGLAREPQGPRAGLFAARRGGYSSRGALAAAALRAAAGQKGAGLGPRAAGQPPRPSAGRAEAAPAIGGPPRSTKQPQSNPKHELCRRRREAPWRTRENP